jgi:hypothetical protein
MQLAGTDFPVSEDFRILETTGKEPIWNDNKVLAG